MQRPAHAPAAARLALAGLAVAGLLATEGAGRPAHAQGPAPPPGAERIFHEAREFDTYALPVGQFGDGQPAVRTVEGAVDRAAWLLDGSDASVAEVVRNYRAQLDAQGFEPLWQCAGEACGGFDFRFGAEILPPPAMQVDVRDFAQLSARRTDPEAFVSVLVSRVLDAIRIQTVTVGTASAAPVLEPPATRTGAEASGSAVEPEDTTETPAPEAPADSGGAGEQAPAEGSLLAALRQHGHVAVPGLEFDTGGVRLSPGSAGALDALARLLLDNEALEILIVGHSDNAGPLALNVDLSRQRAEAVMQALIERGVPTARMEAHGAGFLAPVATNATEVGRAANRRVELVLR